MYTMSVPISWGTFGCVCGWDICGVFVSEDGFPRHALSACWKEAALSSSS